MSKALVVRTRPTRRQAKKKSAIQLNKAQYLNNTNVSQRNIQGNNGQLVMKRTDAPVFKSYGTLGREALISMPGSNVTRVRHTEFIAELVSGDNTPYKVYSFPLNPGKLAPWLIPIASRYEKYRYKALYFTFIPNVGTLSRGTVMMNVDYDASDNPPSDKSTFLSTNYVQEHIWNMAEYDCMNTNLSDVMKSRYVRTDFSGYAGDIKMYDLGNFNIALSRVENSNTVYGDLHVTYDVELITPQRNSGSLPGSSIHANGGIIAQLPLGTVQDEVIVQNPRISLLNNVGNTQQRIIFESIGKYLLDYFANGGTTAGSQGFTTPTFDDLTSGIVDVGDAPQPPTSTATGVARQILVNVLKPNASLNITNWYSGYSVNPTTAHLKATPYTVEEFD